MSALLSLCGAALLLFAATNLDDLLLLVVLCSQRQRHYQPVAVLCGQMLGFSGIVLLSLLGFLSGLVVPERWMACLGLLPLTLGLRQLFGLYHCGGGPVDDLNTGFLGDPEQGAAISTTWRRTTVKVAALTLANGSDNVSVYLPLFGRLTSLEVVVTVITFLLALFALWFLAQWLCQHHRCKHRIQSLGPRLSPLVLIALGIWLLKGSALWPWIL
jgi:cadmium resistance protein CadD (predicted permease)